MIELLLVLLAAAAAAGWALWYGERSRRADAEGVRIGGPRPAIVIPAPPTPEERAAAVARQVDLDFAAAALMEKYAAAGQRVDGDRAREEAAEILRSSGLWGGEP